MNNLQETHAFLCFEYSRSNDQLEKIICFFFISSKLITCDRLWFVTDYTTPATEESFFLCDKLKLWQFPRVTWENALLAT